MTAPYFVTHEASVERAEKVIAHLIETYPEAVGGSYDALIGLLCDLMHWHSQTDLAEDGVTFASCVRQAEQYFKDERATERWMEGREPRGGQVSHGA